MTVRIIRSLYGPDGTFGILVYRGKPLATTCEDPWFDNHKNVSCIPEGKYSCSRHNGTKYQEVWRVEDVPGRSAILIHNGNTIKHTEGCILVGNGFSMFGELPGVKDSLATLDKLRNILPETFELEIGHA